MSVILCAIRGEPECLPTIAQAITLAQETRLPVHFLYVVNRDLLSSANSAQARAISGQIRQMAKSVRGHCRFCAAGYGRRQAS